MFGWMLSVAGGGVELGEGNAGSRRAYRRLRRRRTSRFAACLGWMAMWGARFISLLLVAGGILGILLAVSLTLNFARQNQPARMIVPVVSVVVFGWAALKGIDLWRGKPSGFKWAKIL